MATKTFIRVGSFYQADSPALNGDLDLSEVIAVSMPPASTLPTAHLTTCNCKGEVAELKKQFEELSNLLNQRLEEGLFAEDKIIEKLPEETVVEKSLKVKKVTKPKVVKKVTKVIKKSATKTP